MTGERWRKKGKKKQRKGGGVQRAKSKSNPQGHDGGSLKTANNNNNNHTLNSEETVLCIKVIRPSRPSRARKPEPKESSHTKPPPSRARRRSVSPTPAEKQPSSPPPTAHHHHHHHHTPASRPKSKTRDAMASTIRLRNRNCTTQTSRVLCASKSFTCARTPSPPKSKLNIPSALKLINPKPVIYRVRVMSPEAKEKAKRMHSKMQAKGKAKPLKTLAAPHAARLSHIKYSGKDFDKDLLRKKVRIRTPIKGTYGVNAVEEVLGPQPQWSNEDSEDPGEPNSNPLNGALTMAMVVANSRNSLSTDRNSTSSASIPTLPGFYGSDKIRGAVQTESQRGAIDPKKEFPSWEPPRIVMAKHHKRGAYFAPYRPISRTATATIDTRGVAVCERQPPKSYPDVQRPTTAPETTTSPYTVVEVCAYDTSTTSAAIESKFSGRGVSVPPLRSNTYRQTESSSSPSVTRRCSTWSSSVPRWAGVRPMIRSHTVANPHTFSGFNVSSRGGGGSVSFGGGGVRGSGSRVGGGSCVIPQLTAFSAGILPRVTNSYVTASRGNSRVSMFSTMTPPPSPTSGIRSPTFRPSAADAVSRGLGSLGGMSRSSGGASSKGGGSKGVDSKEGSRSDTKGAHRIDSRASSVSRKRSGGNSQARLGLKT